MSYRNGPGVEQGPRQNVRDRPSTRLRLCRHPSVGSLSDAIMLLTARRSAAYSIPLTRTFHVPFQDRPMTRNLESFPPCAPPCRTLEDLKNLNVSQISKAKSESQSQKPRP